MKPTTSIAKRRPSITVCRRLCLCFGCLVFLLPCTSSRTNAFHVPDAILHFTTGAVAGGAGAVAAYPFDYIKSQMQTEYGKQKFDNGVDAFVETLKQRPLDLYKGVGVQVLGIAPEKGIKLGVNDVLTTACYAQLGGFPVWCQILSGGIAGACQVVASSPLEVLKVGLQTSDMTFPQVWNEVGGAKGLFRGAGACVFRDVLFTAICFPLYNSLVAEGTNTFCAGAISGVVSSFAATPPDVVKTRILSQDKLTLQRKRAQRSAPTTKPQPVATASVSSDSTVVKTTMTMQYNATTTRFDDNTASSAGGSDIFSNQEFYNIKENRNPFSVGKRIVEREGASVLLSGVSERCLGAVPRFGTTLAMHDFLEQVAANQGWLSLPLSS